MKNDHRGRIAALDKALAVLEAFGPSTPDLRISEVAELAGMNRSSVQRTVHTLIRCGYLRRDPASSALSLSYRNALMANTYLSANHLIDMAMLHLVELNARTRLRCDLWVLSGDDVVNIARVPSSAMALAIAPIGQRYPARRSAPGRAILSRLALTEPEKFACTHPIATDAVDGALDQSTFLLTLTDVAARGYAMEFGEMVPQEGAISAAVLGADGQCIAAVSVSGWLRDLAQPEIQEELSKAVIATSRALSELQIQTWARTFSHQTVDTTVRPELPNENEDPLFISSVARSLQVLEVFTPGSPVLTLTDLHRLTGYPVPTVQRMLETLMARGYIEKDPRHKTFRLSVKTLDLLFNLQMSDRVLKTVWPRLVQLRDQCGLRCSFCALEGTNIVHLLHVQSHPHIDFRTAFVGRRLPALSTSGGQAILSRSSDEVLEEVLQESALQPITPYTVIDKSALRQAIRGARDRGYAFTDQQSILDEVNVAAPIVEIDGHPLGAIVVSAPRRDWTMERLDKEIVPRLLPYTRALFS